MTLAVSTARAQTGAPQPSPTLQSETAHHAVSLHGLIRRVRGGPGAPHQHHLFPFLRARCDPRDADSPCWAGRGRAIRNAAHRSGTAGARSWQINLDAGLDALFDMQNKEDSIGWDGTYGLSVTTTSPGRFAFKFGMSHTSGHLGDEYLERTGVARRNYTRQEVAFGVSRQLSPAWRAYGETGIAYVNDGPEQKPFRVQAGGEYKSRPRILNNRFSWYGAGDFSIGRSEAAASTPPSRAGL